MPDIRSLFQPEIFLDGVFFFSYCYHVQLFFYKNNKILNATIQWDFRALF